MWCPSSGHGLLWLNISIFGRCPGTGVFCYCLKTEIPPQMMNTSNFYIFLVPPSGKIASFVHKFKLSTQVMDEICWILVCRGWHLFILSLFYSPSYHVQHLPNDFSILPSTSNPCPFPPSQTSYLCQRRGLVMNRCWRFWEAWWWAVMPNTGSMCVEGCSSWSRSLENLLDTRSSTCCCSCSASVSIR